MNEEHVNGEVVEGLPVLRGPRAPVSVATPPGRSPVPVPARRAAALAATGFVAGVAAVAMAGRRRERKLVRRARRRRKAAVGEILSSNSFLVDVHLLRR